MRNLAVIPARSGSKGLKDKNIKVLCGKPLLAYSVEAAHQAGIFDCVHVSTDSEKYREIAVKYGADVPFLRSREMAADTSSMWDSMRYVINEYRNRGEEFDMITILQPTSPLRTGDDVFGAYKFWLNKKANMVSSVCEMDHSPLWSNVLPDNLSMRDFEDEKWAFLPRQQLPTYYRENGAIYMMKVDHLFGADNIYKDGCYAYIMDRNHSVDIDEELDFIVAEALLKQEII